MGKMKLQILWHMHQPLYLKDDEIVMPWVFLHAIKDYYDMPFLVEKTNSKVTFNITPTLIMQLKMYEKTPLKDKFLRLWLKEVKLLTKEEKEYLLKIIKSINENLIINEKLKELLKFEELNDIEFLNLEILFILSWCGEYLRDKLKNFIEKSFFNEDDKKYLFDELLSFIKTILPYYEKLAKAEIISLWTTPFAHPILPLLLNMNNAKYADENIVLPKNAISLKDDALKHIQKAKKIYKDTFYMDNSGFWPAEGAVDEESLELYKENGIKYIATDEVLLHKIGILNHHIPYNKNGVIIFFRDHILSDLIGFKYKFLNEEEAVNDFLSKLPTEGIVSVILDGENAWEFYKNRGYKFLEKLYLKLNSKMIKADDIEIKDTQNLSHLASGSWIGGNFNTWVGDEEKNRAWELLFQTKKEYLKNGVKSEEIEELFLRAECSDWFWWYGKGHWTFFAKEFDEIFRNYLIEIYKLMNKENYELKIPITKEKNSFIVEPQNEITPIVDGKFDTVFEWYGAGIIYEEKLYSTMDKEKIIKRIYYGMDKNNFYFVFDGEIEKIDKFIIILDDKKIEVNCDYEDKNIKIKKDRIIEIAINKDILANESYIQFDFGEEIIPTFGKLKLEKNKNFEENWFV
jgi:alpha-amylase/alpha-mannosidase (GH57 family)